jgi:hypothetical protein
MWVNDGDVVLPLLDVLLSAVAAPSAQTDARRGESASADLQYVLTWK